MAYLSIKGLNKSFGSSKILKGIDVEIEQGEVVSILGQSGSGKTTLLRCINFLEIADSGSIVLDGKTLFSQEISLKNNEKLLRENTLNFGLVFQSFNLFPQYSVLNNIMLAPLLVLKDNLKKYKTQLKLEAKTNKQLNKKVIFQKINEYKNAQKQQIENNCLELLKRVGLEDKAKYYPCQLSGGQCQRVAIARALALNPKILCFDEPTSALDPELTGEVLKVIQSLKGRATMIIVTHEMNFAKNISDKIIFMAKGVVEEVGTPTEIFENPKSQKLKAFLNNSLNN